ncbi:MAG: hypothetical protein ABJO45_13515, partial [Lentilitoribacter sp.]
MSPIPVNRTFENHARAASLWTTFHRPDRRPAVLRLARTHPLLYLQHMTLTLDKIDFLHMGRTCFGHAARRTANLVTRHYNRHLAGLGLELTQAQLLAAIAEGSAGSAAGIARFLG